MTPNLETLPCITFILEQAYKFDGITTNNDTIELNEYETITKTLNAGKNSKQIQLQHCTR